ncbi:MAG: PIG-L family deacetylase [Firmicutes bacterium]|nr:PIG-L family deacetylase [Bacillota bacterium]
MKFRNEGAEVFIPDNRPVDEAMRRTTHMAISAHQDDIEIMAYDGILKCFGRDDRWFLAVVVTNGAGSPRDDLYASYTDEQMRKIRKHEQKKAAFVGEYSAAVLLDYASSAVKDPNNRDVVDEIKELVLAAKPEVIYTHNLADKHDTHVGVAVKVVKALRELPEDVLPEKLYGCEVWRNLDWVNDEEKVAFDVSAHSNIAAAIVGVFDSQICGGKRYDLATAGRRLANATYAASHGVDTASALIYGMDLTPLIKDKSLDVCEYVLGYVERFKNDVRQRVEKCI